MAPIHERERHRPGDGAFRPPRVEDARITGLDYVRNPQKLSRVEFATPLTPL